MKSETEVVENVKYWAKWWMAQRKKKLVEQLHDTMSINPFIMPFLYDYHDLTDLEELIALIVGSHLLIGHATGFGKLIDEKILPKVFGTVKLSASYRQSIEPFARSCFDEIDHYIVRDNGTTQLLSLKAGRWTIQLSMAVQLNAALNEIIVNHKSVAEEIIVGVFYGKKADLTDKYDILRGVNRGACHNVVDITQQVKVYAGREFWSWLNDGEQKTQEWLLKGILEALREEKIHETASALLKDFKKEVVGKHETDIRDGETLDWFKLLKKING